MNACLLLIRFTSSYSIHSLLKPNKFYVFSMNLLLKQFFTFSNKLVQNSSCRFVLMCESNSPQLLRVQHFVASYNRNLNRKMENDQIMTIVVCGPSGSGKTTLLNMLTSHYKNCFNFCVSHTTRKPREGEIDGHSYHFVAVDTFEKMISKDEFVEFAKFSGNYYGTSYSELAVVKNSGRIPILDVDIRGVTSLKKIGFEAKYVFITTPSFEFLERNLRKRGSEDEDNISKRLRHAIEDIQVADKINFDLVIINGDLDSAFEKFKEFVKIEVDKLDQA